VSRSRSESSAEVRTSSAAAISGGTLVVSQISSRATPDSAMPFPTSRSFS
jgi:hypothetical protein